MKKRLIIYVCILIVCFGCGNASDCFGIFFDLFLPLKVQNAQGENLLNSKYVRDSIQIYYVFPDGCAVLSEHKYDPQKEAFQLYNDIIRIETSPDFFHTHNGQDYDTGIVAGECLMYVKWNSQDTDTIKTTFVCLRPTKDKPLNGYCQWNLYNEVYYNGKQIVSSWEDNQEKMSQGIYPIIVKE